MSRDIRSYFLPTGASKKKDSNKKDEREDGTGIVKVRKRQLIVIDSDSDEDPLPREVKKHKGHSAASPPQAKKANNAKKKKDKNVSKPELKPISVADVFGSSQIKRAATKTSEEVKKKDKDDDVKLMLEDQHSDLEFEATLRQLDEQENLYKKKTASEKEKKQTQDSSTAPKKQTQDSSTAPKKQTQDSSTAPKKQTQDSSKAPKKQTQDSLTAPKKQIQDSSTAPKKQTQDSSTAPKKQTQDSSTAPKKQTQDSLTAPKKHKEGKDSQDSDLEAFSIKAKDKHSSEKKDNKEKSSTVSEKLVNGHDEKKQKQNSETRTSSNLSSAALEINKDLKKEQVDKNEMNSPLERKKSSDDSFSEDAFERKRQHAIQYQKYLQREGPRNPGGKEIPEGKPGCLNGLVFVLTGVMETIDRYEATSIIQQYGGRVTSNVSRNTNYVVVGDDPGPSKIEKASKLGTKQLTEDGLLDLIRTRPGSSDKAAEMSQFKKKASKKIETPSKEHNHTRSEDETKVSEKKEEKQSVSLENKDEKNTVTSAKKEEKKSVKSERKEQTKSVTSVKTEENSISSVKKEDTIVSSSFKTSPPKVSTSPDLKHNAEKSSSLWVDKYKPNSIKQIIGQQGDRSNVKKLLKWLEKWHSNHSGKKKLTRPSPWSKDDFGSYFKAALLSGPPGVGKTTSAHLVCKELGFDVVEFNASDTRSKKLLHEEVSELLSTKSLSGYFQSGAGMKPTEKHVLVMDEVDGMAGNEDRGGVQELIQLIKNSRVPIICMCNDRHHPKIRSLTNYCFDLQFSKPRLEQIRGAMMSICFKEGIKISPEGLNDIIGGANQDIRQVMHHLSMWSVNDKNLSTEQVKEEAQKAKKNIKLGPWDVLRKVFSADAHKTMSIHDKSDLFFHDYSLGPLFVQENYLSVLPHKAKGNRNKHLEIVAKTAESLSSGDLVEKSIRSRNAWSLLPMQAMYSSVIPGDVMEGHLTSQINFPAWLGKNSRRNKLNRLVQELHMHMRLSISGSREAVNLDYLQHIRDALINPLIKEGGDGVPATLSVMQNYYLMREDIDSVMELSLWPNQKDPMSLVDSKVKAALTRTYNKEGMMTPYSVVSIKKTSAKSSQETDMDMDADGDIVEDENEEEEEDITKDAMIKAKKRPASSRGDSAGQGPASKRGRGGSKGGGKKDSKGKKK